MKHWLTWAAVLTCLGIGVRAGAQSSHNFAVNDTGWRGLSQFVDLAQSRGIDLQAAETLDYSKLGPDGRLVIIHPETPLDERALATFVINGGRVLLADDFGRSGPMLKRLDIDRTTEFPAGYPHDAFLEDNRSAPILTPRGVHPLLEGVDRLVANHPVVLDHSGGAVVPYSGRGGLVFDMNLEAGKVVVVGDSSLFINHMLGRADNRPFAANALKYLCEGVESCSPTLLSGNFTQVGRADETEDESEQGWDAALDAANERIAEVMQSLPASPLMYYLAILLTIGLAAYLATVMSIRRPPSYSSYVRKSLDERPEAQSEFEWNLNQFTGDEETNLALPAAMLKEIVEEIILKELGVWDVPKSERPSLEALAEKIVQRARDNPDVDVPDREEVVDTLSRLARVPTRQRAMVDGDAYFSTRDLLQLYGRAQVLLRILGCEEEYERRTRTLIGEPSSGEPARGRRAG